MQLEGGHRYSIKVEYTQNGRGGGAELNWIPPAPCCSRMPEEVARDSDVALVFVGLNGSQEGEGHDRSAIDLPEPQESLVKAMIATGKPVVVVLTSGSAVAINSAAAGATAVLSAWYGGEEAGSAIADTLAGVNNPAGRLPVTFYKSLDQVPEFTDYSMKNRTYRYFKGEPLYPFGYGLSYSTFAYSGLNAKRTAGGAEVSATVKNTSSREGDEVVQLYIGGGADADAPIRNLRGFQRIHLKPGESRQVKFTLIGRGRAGGEGGCERWRRAAHRQHAVCEGLTVAMSSNYLLLFASLTSLVAFPVPASAGPAQAAHRSWAADNGNGTYSNPLFYDEFSDPDMIRVGADYYLTGTTMHTMPGLPILHSRDLVNWRIIAYAFDRLDLGPDFRLEEGKQIYGQGIWAPSFRYHNGTFYIFANVNRFGLQVFRASSPRGPWSHNRIEQGLHDLSVLFDDDGKIYAVYGARTIRIVELNQDLTALVPGTDRVLIDSKLGMGEGSHFYKINGKYYIVSAIPGAHVPMKCARADRLTGPWEIETISAEESLGIGQGYRPKGGGRRNTPPMEANPPDSSQGRDLDLHQGGIIATQTGEWWGFSMQDHNSVGRLTSLSPVTWENGWPYFGLPGNLRRTPSIWVKPNTGHTEPDFVSVPTLRRFFGTEAADGLAVESRTRRHEVVAFGAAGVSPSAFAAGPRFLVGAKLADPARPGTGIHGHHGVGRQRPQSR